MDIRVLCLHLDLVIVHEFDEGRIAAKSADPRLRVARDCAHFDVWPPLGHEARGEVMGLAQDFDGGWADAGELRVEVLWSQFPKHLQVQDLGALALPAHGECVVHRRIMQQARGKARPTLRVGAGTAPAWARMTIVKWADS